MQGHYNFIYTYVVHVAYKRYQSSTKTVQYFTVNRM